MPTDVKKSVNIVMITPMATLEKIVQRKKAKLVGTSVLKKDVNAGDSDDKQVKGATGHQKEEPDKNKDANHHSVQIKGIAKSGGCLNCKDPNHTFRTCENECKFCTDNTDGHIRKDCRKGKTCFNCNQIGHVLRDCPDKEQE
ncbi:hypothetical protein Anas_04918 [Armadillidium nasatum]|uniref:CCHC-type domain-containing protein n=1 Tax=Armadillidium nasatum TaxID=96803 RepID=A0A5N5SRU8_9CRUS|nr:hypothetical protein Anas_04918 [Armadillidium nasatum]